MRRARDIALYSLIGLMSLSLGPTIGGVGSSSGVAMAQNRYTIGYYRSQTGGISPASTVVSITNHALGSCDVSVVWRDLSNRQVCKTTSNIGSQETHQHCSNTIDPRLTECEITCMVDTENSVELTDHEGRALVTVNRGQNCLVNLIVDSRVYFTRLIEGGFSQIDAVFSPRITLIPIGTTSGAGNQGD